jgi:4-amino-4-deoxy-L-arabinose transferase-like glycosyltransferase
MVGLSAVMQRVAAANVSPGAGVIAGLLFGSFPLLLIVSNQVMAEALTAFFVTLALFTLYAALRRESLTLAATAGILTGIATLTRPVALYLPIPLFLILLARRRFPIAFAFAIAAAALPATWALRNYRQSGVAVVSSIEGENLLLYRAAGTVVVADKPPLDRLFAFQKQFGFYREALRIRVPLIRQALAGLHPMNHAQRSMAYARLGLRMVARHPVTYLELAISSIISICIDDLAWLAAQQRGWDIVTARILLVPVSVGLVVCAIFGIRQLFRRDRDLAWLIILTIAYFLAVSAGPEGDSRFSVPYLALYIIAIAAGVSALTRPGGGEGAPRDSHHEQGKNAPPHRGR